MGAAVKPIGHASFAPHTVIPGAPEDRPLSATWIFLMMLAIMTNTLLLPYIVGFHGRSHTPSAIVFTCIDLLYVLNLLMGPSTKRDVFNQGGPVQFSRYLRRQVWYDVVGAFPVCWVRALYMWDAGQVYQSAWRVNTLLMTLYWPKFWQVSANFPQPLPPPPPPPHLFRGRMQMGTLRCTCPQAHVSQNR